MLARRSSQSLQVLALAGLACAREPLPEICPLLDPGELVISELRGDQDDDDSFGHYVELYNAADRSIDLQGVRLRVRAQSGKQLEFFVRDELLVPAGGYVVLGPGVPDEPAMWIDYAIGWDITESPDPDNYPRTLLAEAGGIIGLESCGELVDEVVYVGLPDAGTFACGSVDAPPDAATNDDTSTGCWCTDAAEADPDYPLLGLGLPGTPGRANRCAP